MKEKLLSEKSNKTLNGLSKAIEVICKISKVFVMIGIVCVALATVVLGVVFSKIKISGNEIKIKGVKDKIVFVEKDNGVALKFNNEESETINIKISEVNKFLNQNSVSKLALFTELNLIVVIIYMIITYLVLGKIIKVFKNTRTDSPFVKDNIIYIRKIAYYLIAIIILGIVNGIANGLIFDELAGDIVNTPSIMAIVFLFALAYIFEYGYELENKKEKSSK